MLPHLDTVSTIRSTEHELALRRIQQRPRIAAPRITFLSLACLLTLATGVVLLGLAATLSSSGQPVAAGASPAEAVTAVRAFYAAVNEVLRTGNPTPLESVVAPALVEHADRPGLPSGQVGLVRYLAALRAAYPTLRFEVDDLLADGGQVSARVTATSDPDRPLPDGAAPPAAAWHGVDIFRVEDGRVSERWSGSDAPSLAHPLARVPVDVRIPTVTVAAMARFSYAPGAGLTGAALPGPGFVAVEAGALTVRGNGLAQVFHAATLDPSVPPVVIPPGADEVLRPGDVVAFPLGTSTLHNHGPEPVVALAVSWFPHPGSHTFERTMTRHGDPTSDGALALAMLPVADGGQPANLAGIAVEPLGSLGLAKVPPGPAVVTLNRTLLLPGASLPPLPAQGSTLLAVQAGTLGLVPARETAQMRSSIQKETIASTGLEAALTTGDTAVWDAGAVAIIRGGADTAGAALFLTITSDAPIHLRP